MGNPFEGLFDSGNVLERVGIDITAQARRGDLEPVRCRDAEVARVIDILLRQGKNNAALVGRAGVGKTAIVEGLAQRIAAGNVPPALKDARILGLDHVSMLAGTSFRGQYEDRIRRLIQALQADRNGRGDGRGQHAETRPRARRHSRHRRDHRRGVHQVDPLRPRPRAALSTGHDRGAGRDSDLGGARRAPPAA